jgi:hypothetical protein
VNFSHIPKFEILGCGSELGDVLVH